MPEPRPSRPIDPGSTERRVGPYPGRNWTPDDKLTRRIRRWFRRHA